MCIAVLGHPGSNILLPKPGFPLYQTLCCSFNVQVKFYKLNADRGWEIDLEDLDSLIDEKTAAIVYNNPSNPAGSVYSRKHISDFLEVAEKHRVPVIADEIYGDLVFSGEKFIPSASLATEVPILTCGGTTKR